MPAVGARIADELVPFVERLSEVQRLLGAEAEETVGVPLKLGEVVERRRRHALRLGFDGLDGRFACAGAIDDEFGFVSFYWEPHGLLQRFLFAAGVRTGAKPGSLISVVFGRTDRVKGGLH